MALLGGAGNPVGGSFTGPAEALEIIGDHAYAYSGSIDVENQTTVLDFTSGNYYFVGKFEFAGNWSDAGSNYVLVNVSFNDVVVLKIAEHRDLGAGSEQPFSLIIPPYTEVKVVYAGVGASTEFTTNLTGRIYRTRD